MIDATLLVVTEHVPAPTATDVGLSKLAPTRLIVRIPVVEHPKTWRSAVGDGSDGSPQETVLTNGMSEQKTPRLGVAETHSSDDSHGVLVQVASLVISPRGVSVCEEGCGLMMLRDAEDATLKA